MQLIWVILMDITKLPSIDCTNLHIPQQCHFYSTANKYLFKLLDFASLMSECQYRFFLKGFISFIFGCAGSSLLHAGFLWLQMRVTLL